MSEPRQSWQGSRDRRDRGRDSAAPSGSLDERDLRMHGEDAPRLPLVPDVREPRIGDVAGDAQEQPDGAEVGGEYTERSAHAPVMPFTDALPLGTAVPLTGDRVPEPEWLRLQVRQLIREFLSVVPRSQASATLTFPRPDGTPRSISRAVLSTAIDRMRPRQKQIIRLAVEERRSQEEVCALLNGISVRTLQRDQAEALDLLAQL
jgi:hypothetical protein